MRIFHFSLSFILTCIVFETASIQIMGGGPPLVTDDTGTPGHNRWEVNLAYTRLDTVVERNNGVVVDANYGFGNKTQLNLVVPYVSFDHDRDGRYSGLDDIQLATKFRFIGETCWCPSVSATPTVFLPTGNNRSKPDFFLPLEFDRNIKSLYVGSQIGYIIHQEKDTNNELFYGFFVERSISKKITAVGETFGFLTEHEEANPPLFNGGFRYRVNKVFSVMGSAGRSFGNRSNGEPHLLGYIGIRLNF